MSTKMSIAHNNGEDGRTDYHLYLEAFSDSIHLRLKNIENEIICNRNGSLVTIEIPEDILDDIIDGLIDIKMRRLNVK